MVAPEIEPRLVTAGREFGETMAHLGMEPHALFWAYDAIQSSHVLVLITDFFDQMGPLEISRQLFKAYNASITPKEVDPFIIRLHSVNQQIGRDYIANFHGNWHFEVIGPSAANVAIGNFEIIIGELSVRPEWVMSAKERESRTSVEIGRRWRRFVRNVELAAA